MKRFLSVIALAGLAVVAVQAADGDEYEAYPYNFVGVKGGVQLVPTNYDHLELLKPIGGVQLGRFYAPEVGLRLDVQGWQSRGGLKSIDHTYHWAYITSDVDLLLNLSNILSKTKVHKWNWILVAGVGLTYAWDNDDLNNLVAHGVVTEKNIENWDEHCYSHNFRAGLLLDYNISRHWGANVEVDANNLSDRFNSKTNGKCDWQLTAMLGVNYKWGHKKKAVAPVVVPEPEPEPEPAPAPVVKEEPKPEPAPAPVAPVVLKPEERHVDIFFERNNAKISEAEDAKLRNLSAWMKDHKAKVTVKGYADKGTGTTAINKRLAQQRANQVADELVKTYGIPRSAIEVSSYGDTVQPFAENDKNRVARVDFLEILD